MNRTQQIAVLLISEYFLTVSGRSTSEALTLCQPFINSAYLASDSHSQGTAIWHAHVTSQRVICLFKLASLCIRAGFCTSIISCFPPPLAQAYFTTTLNVRLRKPFGRVRKRRAAPRHDKPGRKVTVQPIRSAVESLRRVPGPP